MSALADTLASRPSPDAVAVTMAAAARAAARGGGAAAIPHTREVPPGTRLAKLVLCQALVQGGFSRGLVDFASTVFRDDPAVSAIARTMVGAADTTTAGWAAELVRSETTAIFEDALVPLSIWARLASLGTSVGFGDAQSVLVPQLTVATAGGGAWVGEGGEIPLVKGTLSAARLKRYKLGGLVPITKELQQRSVAPGAVQVVRALLLQSIANMLDSSMIDSSAEVPGTRPSGLLHGVTPGTGSAGGGISAATADVKLLVGQLLAANPGARPALILNPSEAVSLALMARDLGGLFGTDAPLPVALVASAVVPVGLVIAIDVASFVSGTDDISIDTSEEGTFVAADAGGAAPSHAGAVAGGGALGTPGQVVPDGGILIAGSTGASAAGAVAVSLWETWSIGVRLVMPASFAVTRPGAVQALQGVSW